MARSRTVFSASLVATIALVAVVAGVVGGRATGSASASSGSGNGGRASGNEVDVIIKASDSWLWQVMPAGAKRAGEDSSALNSAIDRARKAGLKVVTVDTRVTTTSESFIGTDDVRAGQQAGVRMCDLLKAHRTSGVVLVESSVAGIQYLVDRDSDVKQGLAAGCPQAQASLQRYNNNDINTVASQVNDALIANKNLPGV